MRDTPPEVREPIPFSTLLNGLNISRDGKFSLWSAEACSLKITLGICGILNYFGNLWDFVENCGMVKFSKCLKIIDCIWKGKKIEAYGATATWNFICVLSPCSVPVRFFTGVETEVSG